MKVIDEKTKRLKRRKLRQVREFRKKEMEEAHWRLYQAKTHVKDLQQIYDTVNGSLHMAKLQLEVYEEQNQKAIDEYHTSVGVEK